MQLSQIQHSVRHRALQWLVALPVLVLVACTGGLPVSAEPMKTTCTIASLTTSQGPAYTSCKPLPKCNLQRFDRCPALKGGPLLESVRSASDAADFNRLCESQSSQLAFKLASNVTHFAPPVSPCTPARSVSDVAAATHNSSLCAPLRTAAPSCITARSVSDVASTHTRSLRTPLCTAALSRTAAASCTARSVSDVAAVYHTCSLCTSPRTAAASTRMASRSVSDVAPRTTPSKQ